MDWLGGVIASVIGIVFGVGLKSYFDYYNRCWISQKKHDDLVFKLYIECVNNLIMLRDMCNRIDSQISQAKKTKMDEQTLINLFSKLVVDQEMYPLKHNSWNSFLQIELTDTDQLVVSDGILAYDLLNNLIKTIILNRDGIYQSHALAKAGEEYQRIAIIGDGAKSAFLVISSYIHILRKHYAFLRKPQFDKLLQNANFELDKTFAEYFDHCVEKGYLSKEALDKIISYSKSGK
ncbi:MAG: hypothetical protein ACYC27_18765 [Armatimonadota bacterium]